MRVKLTSPDDTERVIDTPDPMLVGLWLKAIFDEFGKSGPHYVGRIPTQFILEVYA
jgi:hypothetical protein